MKVFHVLLINLEMIIRGKVQVKGKVNDVAKKNRKIVHGFARACESFSTIAQKELILLKH